MHCEHYGDSKNPTIVFLHGANFVHAFGRQYPLSDRFHILVPHIMGYGDEADKVFETEAATNALVEFIRGLDRKVFLVGFSLGAQLAVKMIAEHPELFKKAIIVSPMLIKQEPELSKLIEVNKKQLASMKKPFLCNLMGLMNGLPKAKRQEFVQQMQNVQVETQVNMVDNGITLHSVSAFRNADVPSIVLAGAKEPKSVIDSAQALAKMNEHCEVQIWDKAKHNIPPVHARRFNELIVQFFADK